MIFKRFIVPFVVGILRNLDENSTARSAIHIKWENPFLSAGMQKVDSVYYFMKLRVYSAVTLNFLASIRYCLYLLREKTPSLPSCGTSDPSRKSEECRAKMIREQAKSWHM